MVTTQSAKSTVQANGPSLFIYLTKAQISLLGIKKGNKIIITAENPEPDKIYKPARGLNFFKRKEEPIQEASTEGLE